MRRIIAIAGPVAAGKSDLSRKLALALAAQRVSFGDYVRSVAEDRGVPLTRGALQGLGEQLISDLGAVEFTTRTVALAPPTDTLIVDGIRHVAVNAALAAQADDYHLIFVEADNRTRTARLEKRGEGPVDLVAIDSHSTEVEQPELRKRADLIADGTDPAAASKLAAALE
jgi:cytidylate kinase